MYLKCNDEVYKLYESTTYRETISNGRAMSVVGMQSLLNFFLEGDKFVSQKRIRHLTGSRQRCRDYERL